MPVTIVLLVNVFSNRFVHTIDNFLEATLILYLNCVINISDEHLYDKRRFGRITIHYEVEGLFPRL